LAMSATQGGTPFKDALKSSAKVASILSTKEIDEFFTNDYYLRRVQELYARVGL
jgi:adenylosuccinate lyase